MIRHATIDDTPKLLPLLSELGYPATLEVSLLGIKAPPMLGIKAPAKPLKIGLTNGSRIARF